MASSACAHDMVDALLGFAAQPADTESAPIPEPSQLVLGLPYGTIDSPSAVARAPCRATHRAFHVLTQGLRGRPRALLHLFDGSLRSPSPLAHTGPLRPRCPMHHDLDVPDDTHGLGSCNDRRMIAAFSITPLGVGDSVSTAVAEAVRLVRASGLPNETNAMFTNIEGEWDEVMSLIKHCVEKVGESAPRVSVVIKLDLRPGAIDALVHKVEAIESHLDAS